MKTALLVGFPNSGKSTLYNLLCGGSRKVTNYSGVTVDSAVGELRSNEFNEEKIKLVDLPGTYNVVPTSPDEGVTVSHILSLSEEANYNLVALVLDMERLESSLSLCLALKDVIGDRMVVIVNKDDNKEFSSQRCSNLEELIGLKVLSTSSKASNLRELDRFIRDYTPNEEVKVISDVKMTEAGLDFIDGHHLCKNIKTTQNDEEILEAINSYHLRARKIIDEVIKPDSTKAEMTKKIDRILIHPFFGSIIFMTIFYLIFNSIYEWSGPLMDLIDGAVGGFSDIISQILPEGMIKSLIVDGIIAGVGGVIIFAPQIGILFLLLSLLEQSGYISRAAVLTDKIMSIFGLNGKAFLPYLSGFACSIPAIMAARTIPSRRERIATIMTIPLVTCSARLPVYVLLIGTFVPEKTVLGIFNSQALSFFFLYFLGGFFALVIAKIFRLTAFKGKTSTFYMDLPFYQRPSLKIAFSTAMTKVGFFCKKAGTIILGLSVLIWFASTFPKVDPSELIGKSEEQVASIQLEQSLMGTLGRTIEPVLKPIGMDWKMGVGVLVAFGARELFVSTMGTIYALGEVDEESSTLRERLMNEKDPKTGEPVFNLAVAWSILIFFVFSLQCTSTLAILRKELGEWKTPVFMFTYMGVLAWVGSFIAYRLLI